MPLAPPVPVPVSRPVMLSTEALEPRSGAIGLLESGCNVAAPAASGPAPESIPAAPAVPDVGPSSVRGGSESIVQATAVVTKGTSRRITQNAVCLVVFSIPDLT